MTNSIKKIYYLELIMLGYVILLNIISKILNSNVLIDTINVIFWIIIAIIILLKYRFPRDKDYSKGSTVRIVIIGLLSFLIFSYALGLITGYSRSIFNHSIIGIIKNIGPIILVIISQEYIRYIICKNSPKDFKPILILTVIYIVNSVFNEMIFYNFIDNESIFIFICGPVLTNISRHTIYSYLTYKVSLTPSIIMRISLEIYPYLLPFYPSLGNYIESILNVALPYAIYKNISNIIVNNEISNDEKIHYKNAIRKIVLIPIAIFLIILVTLVSGLTKYKMIAIGSNSMKPIYARGDAIIYEKITNDKYAKIGEIIAFKRNETIMTHRIVSMNIKNNEIFYKTKGDANKNNDSFETSSKDVLGVVKWKTKYIGYPTIWITEKLFNKQ